ncbi:MAG: 2-isopropylmalate synthase [Hadesarchaea archaeon]|nr:MAG: 2-isopropylmalate synthase [Hadesarchaea archaeon]
MKPRIKVLDTTLRDGEQMPGLALSPEQKLEIAVALDELGVDIIEAGSAIVSEGEREALKRIVRQGLKAEICSFSRGVKEDIEAALSCEVDSVHLVLPTSDIHLRYKLRKSRSQLKEMAREACRYALDHGLTVELSAEDGTRTDPQFLKEFFSVGKEEGVQRLCVCDTVGVMTPDRIQQLFSDLAGSFDLPLSVHCHDDFGMATANTVSAVRGGAREVHVTVNGLGERAGNASLEEVVMALHYFHGFRTGIRFRKLYQTSRLVERLTGVPVPPNKAIVGDNAFSHESGIHTHGVLRFPGTYEPLSPELVGHHRRLVLGKHAGSKSVEKELREMGLRPTRDQLREITKQLKALADKGKRITDADIRAIAEHVVGKLPAEKKVVEIKEIIVNTGNTITPTASVRLLVRGKERVGSSVGVGPVDAAINAIRNSLSEVHGLKLKEYHLDAITGGSDALAEVTVKLEDERGNLYISKGVKEDVVLASVEAMVNGINKYFLRKG